MSHDDIQSLWQNQPVSELHWTVDDLRKKARGLERSVLFRNLLEYAACVLVIGVFTGYWFSFATPLMRSGSVLVILGTCTVAWQLHRRASAATLPQQLAQQGCSQFYRQQLVRQRDALRAVWLWYLGPLIPGTVVFRWGVETELSAGAPFARGLLANLAIALIFALVLLANWLAARRVQKEIQRLDQHSVSE